MATFKETVAAMTAACGAPDDVRPTVVRWFNDPTDIWPAGVSVSHEGESIWITIAGGTSSADDLRVGGPEGNYTPLRPLDEAVDEAESYLRACRPLTTAVTLPGGGA